VSIDEVPKCCQIASSDGDQGCENIVVGRRSHTHEVYSTAFARLPEWVQPSRAKGDATAVKSTTEVQVSGRFANRRPTFAVQVTLDLAESLVPGGCDVSA
jgi:hypothetical protein